MPSRCSVRVIEARDLPLMDRDFAGAEFTDAFVEVRFASFEPCRTAVRRTQQPKWDEEFRFEVVDDAVLQARVVSYYHLLLLLLLLLRPSTLAYESNHPPPLSDATPAVAVVVQASPIEFKVMDHDVITADDTIGLVHVDLSPLLMRLDFAEPDQGEQLLFQGWLPLFDTLNGIRGERARSAAFARARSTGCDAQARALSLRRAAPERAAPRAHVRRQPVGPLVRGRALLEPERARARRRPRRLGARSRARALSLSASRLSQEREREAARASGMKRSPSPLSFSFPPQVLGFVEELAVEDDPESERLARERVP